MLGGERASFARPPPPPSAPWGWAQGVATEAIRRAEAYIKDDRLVKASDAAGMTPSKNVCVFLVATATFYGATRMEEADDVGGMTIASAIVIVALALTIICSTWIALASILKVVARTIMSSTPSMIMAGAVVALAMAGNKKAALGAAGIMFTWIITLGTVRGVWGWARLTLRRGTD